MIKNNDYFNVRELASFLGVKVSTVYQYTHLKKIPHRKIGKKILFKKSEIIEFIEKNKVEEKKYE